MNKQNETFIHWIDIAKGIGIALVVIGHVFDKGDRYIFWFHMPLFFFVSGFLYKPDYSLLVYLKRKFFHLLVPYFSFLLLLSIPDYMKCYKMVKCGEASTMETFIPFTLKQLAGGRELYGWFDIFWFVTCLFLTQQIFNFVFHICKKRIMLVLYVVICLYITTIISNYAYFFRLPLFWGLNVVPMAFTFFFLGKIISEDIMFKWQVISVASILFVSCIVLSEYNVIHHEFRMKWAAYGIPGLNLLIAVTGIIITCYVARLLSNVGFLKVVLSEIGKASLVVMFLHQAFRQLIFDRLSNVENPFIITITLIISCFCMYKIVQFHHYTRVIFLGDFQRKDTKNS